MNASLVCVIFALGLAPEINQSMGKKTNAPTRNVALAEDQSARPDELSEHCKKNRRVQRYQHSQDVCPRRSAAKFQCLVRCDNGSSRRQK